MMERRLEQRHPLRIGVRVRDRSGRVFSFPTRNISPNGAFIETGPVDLSAEGVLWVDLPDPEAEGGWNDVASLVVHHHQDGVGVMFSYPYAALKQLSGSHRQSRAAA